MFSGAVKTTTSLVVYTVAPTKTTFAFNRTVNREFVQSNTALLINNKTVLEEWKSTTGNEFDTVWVLEHVVAENDVYDVKVR